MKKTYTLLTAFLFAFLTHLNAQPGSLDPTFGDGGKVITSFLAGVDELSRSVAVQPDGKIIVAGEGFFSGAGGSDVTLCRYNPDGSLDLSFDNDGKVTTAVGTNDDNAEAIVLQSDGKIITAGYTRVGNTLNMLVLRYNSNGSLDLAFGTNGKVIASVGSLTAIAQAVAIQNDGKIVVGGEAYNSAQPYTTGSYVVLRYNSNGSPDNTFGVGGRVTTLIGISCSLTSLVMQGDGKIVVAGTSNNGNNYDFGLARYNTDGSPDLSFDGDGIVVTTFGNTSENATALAIQGDGKIVAAGYFSDPNTGTTSFCLARYNVEGSPDATFDGDGKVTTAFGPNIWALVSGIAIQNDGKIIASGRSSRLNINNSYFSLARYNINGSLDSGFGTNGKAIAVLGPTDDVATALVLYNTRIYVAGYSYNGTNYDFALAAFQNNALPLPLRLTSFSAVKINSSITCQWSTAPQANTSYFIVQRSIDGIAFENAGQVYAVSTAFLYSYKDQLTEAYLTSPVIYYRLKMYDKDGKFTYSPLVTVRPAGAHLFEIYPNPATDYLVVNGRDLVEINVFNISGKFVEAKTLFAATDNRIYVGHLAKGIYTIKLKDKTGAIQIQKVVLH